MVVWEVFSNSNYVIPYDKISFGFVPTSLTPINTYSLCTLETGGCEIIFSKFYELFDALGNQYKYKTPRNERPSKERIRRERD